MAQVTSTELRELRELIIGLRQEMKGDSGSLREEMRVGFAHVDRKIEVGFANVETGFANIDKKIEVGFANTDTKFAQIDTAIVKLDGKIDKLEAKFEERTRLGFWGFIFRAVSSTVLAGVILLLIRYLFPNLAT